MELHQVDPQDAEEIIRDTLKTLISDEELEELTEGLMIEVEDGSKVFSIREKEQLGFLIATPLNSDFESDEIDLISIEDVFIKSGIDPKTLSDSLSIEIKNIASELGVDQIEVIVSQQNDWLGEGLKEHGYIVSEIKLEKLLPRANNLEDVLDLIQDSTPLYRIVQVLLEKDDEFMADFVENIDEIESQLEDGWTPVMVIVTFEPETQEIDKLIAESDQLVNWDDYSVVYYI